MSSRFKNNTTVDRIKLNPTTLLESLETSLRELVSDRVDTFDSALRFLQSSGGKRVRPLLSLLLFQDLGGDPRKLLKVVLALELVHNASLIHDDLPAIDNDDYRRGKPSFHRVFGEGQAVLFGDYLISLAFKVLAQSDFDAAVRIRFISTLGDAFCKLCQGQELDLEQNPEKDLRMVNQLKTGALFSATCRFAAIGGAFPVSVEDLAAELGLYIGQGFQIADDFVDRFGTSESRGRPESSDARNKKATLASIHSAEELRSELDLLKGAIENCIAKIAAAVRRPEADFSGTRYILDLIVGRIER